MSKHSSELRECLKINHTICIYEGGAEQVIINTLFQNNKLAFKKGDYFEEERLIRDFTSIRQGKKFAQEFLQRDYGHRGINILRILDSRREKFNLGKVYNERLKKGEIRVLNILTRPEIEMLIIINEGHYTRFSNRGNIKASDYCKKELNIRDVKSKKFVASYFKDIKILINTIVEYNRVRHKNNDFGLFDLLDLT